MSHLLPFCRESQFVANTRFLGLFCADFYADIWDLTQILRRYLYQKSAADSSGLYKALKSVVTKSEKIGPASVETISNIPENRDLFILYPICPGGEQMAPLSCICVYPLKMINVFL